MNRAGVLAVLGLACLSQGWADDPVVFRSSVSLVRVDAQVVDRDNRAITNLGPRDFILRENGTPQRIQSVDSENLPVDLLMLLDVSASMRPHIQRIASAAHEAMRQLREQDRVAIMVFDRSTRVRMGFRSSQEDVDREFERLLDQETFHGGTDITRGLLDAADYIRRQGRAEAKKAIVIVTDDQTERNRDVDGVSRALTRADAVLCALIAPDAMQYRNRRYPGGGPPGGGYPGGGYPGGGYPGGPLGGPLGGIILGRRGGYPGGGYPGGGGAGTQSAGTAEIARRSGGDSLPVDEADALRDTLARIRQRYELHFYLPPGVHAGDERSIDLELAGLARSRYPDAQLRYRHEYYAAADGPSTGGAGGSQPVVVTQSGASDPTAAPAPADDPDRPRYRRRGVSQVGDSSPDGPLVGADPGPATGSPAPAAAPSNPAWKKADPTQAAPPASPQSPGWRKARPDEVQQQQQPQQQP